MADGKATHQDAGEEEAEDMTARDLLQQRYTLSNGDTAWRPSPLVTAAIEGKLLLLDGIHRVNLGTLAVLSRLLHDRELDLYDGTRLLRSIFPIHPSFRVLSLAEPPVVGTITSSSSNSRGQQWLGPELLTMFLYHTVTPLAKGEEMGLIQGLTPNVPMEAAEQLLHLTQFLKKTNDPTAQSLASSLSTRQLLRICRRLSQYPKESIAHAVNKACLSSLSCPVKVEVELSMDVGLLATVAAANIRPGRGRRICACGFEPVTESPEMWAQKSKRDAASQEETRQPWVTLRY
ncbi:von Willebrand factor A domain-containing protein 8 [Lates japonicus]|uniref:von Willebrand factor A domain-containing protein 8 n=1 Tax=Lates japonicus TaxID=270547 RepID=A0AAD3NP37_LATJO|nr:von Willebrand factor A domain-containing protein 8 [Lates japonicus]